MRTLRGLPGVKCSSETEAASPGRRDSVSNGASFLHIFISQKTTEQVDIGVCRESGGEAQSCFQIQPVATAVSAQLGKATITHKDKLALQVEQPGGGGQVQAFPDEFGCPPHCQWRAARSPPTAAPGHSAGQQGGHRSRPHVAHRGGTSSKRSRRISHWLVPCSGRCFGCAQHDKMIFAMYGDLFQHRYRRIRCWISRNSAWHVLPVPWRDSRCGGWR